MNNDFYNSVCKSVDAILKQFIFNLHDDSTHQQIYRMVTNMLLRRADVAHCNVQVVRTSVGRVHIIADFRDYTQRNYTYQRRIV